MQVLHPPFVHFVVALPVVALFSQLTYMATRDRAYSKAAFRIIAMTLLASLFALYTGMTDAQRVLDAHTLTAKGVELISTHKMLGIVSVIILLLTTLTKWFAVAKRSHAMETLAAFLIIVTIAVTLYQGRMGGSIVYQYGAGVESRQIVTGKQ